MDKRPLAVSCRDLDCRPFLVDWQWLVPDGMDPLMIGIFGDWIFAAADGTLWHLDLLEGEFQKIAEGSQEFNEKKEKPRYRNEWFGEEWANIALGNGLVPELDECLGWIIPPVLGGEFAVENIQVFSISVYQSATGSLFRQLGKS